MSKESESLFSSRECRYGKHRWRWTAWLCRRFSRCPDCGARNCKGTPDSRLWTPSWMVAPAPKGDDEAQAEALYETHVRTIGRDAIRQPSWDAMDEWKRESWRRELRDV